jgi:5-methylcytosine-specific restriction protein A
MDFASRYGPLGNGFIHVHHLMALHTVPEGYRVNPIADLVPLCPNCHAMVHRRDPMLTIDELRDLLRSGRGHQRLSPP